MRLVIVGDIHAYTLLPMPWRLMGKPLAGQLNLWLRRRRRFCHALMPRVLEHATSRTVDLALLPGDLTTLSLPGEFVKARRMLAPLLGDGSARSGIAQAGAAQGSGAPAVLVAGNHDRYTGHAFRARLMERYFADQMPKAYPFKRELAGGWWLVAVDTAVARGWDSRGLFTDHDVIALERCLRDLPAGAGAIVMAHYPCMRPPGVHQARQHRLENERGLEGVLVGANRPVIFVHGHIHQPWCHRVNDQLIDLCAGGPAMLDDAYPLGQGYWTIELSSGRLDATTQEATDATARPVSLDGLNAPTITHHRPVPPTATAATTNADADAPAPAPDWQRWRRDLMRGRVGELTWRSRPVLSPIKPMVNDR